MDRIHIFLYPKTCYWYYHTIENKLRTNFQFLPEHIRVQEQMGKKRQSSFFFAVNLMRWIIMFSKCYRQRSWNNKRILAQQYNNNSCTNSLKMPRFFFFVIYRCAKTTQRWEVQPPVFAVTICMVYGNTSLPTILCSKG